MDYLTVVVSQYIKTNNITKDSLNKDKVKLNKDSFTLIMQQIEYTHKSLK